MNLAWLNTHKWYLLGGLAGVVVFYLIYESISSGASSSSSGSTDLSTPGSSGVTSYDAAASLSNAQVNGSVEIAQVQAGVQSEGIAAQLQSNEVTTAAELAATENTNSTAVAEAQISSNTTLGVAGIQGNVTEALGKDAVESQQIVTSGQVAQTQIVGDTIDTLGAQHESVQKQQLSIVGSQVQQIQDNSKHASQDYAAIAPILAIETGQQTAAVGTADANSQNKKAAASTTNTAISAGASIFSSLLDGLFSS
jgi:hypothetical protein